MNGEITFNCMHCNQQIDASEEFAGQEATCPGCQKVIVVPNPQKANDYPSMIANDSYLMNRNEKEVLNCLKFLEKYENSYCKDKASKEQNIRLLTALFKNGAGPAMAKKFANANFTGSMQGSKSSKSVDSTLFNNKKLNKQIKSVMKENGMKVKGGLFGIFG